MEQPSTNHIVLVDAIRGFALMGIMLLHANEHFDLFWNADQNPAIFQSIDPHVSRLIVFLFSGKAYSIFSLMFGFSFFIQMDRSASKGMDFTWRFLWRLMVLFMIGYSLSLMYSSQILVLYAVLGLSLGKSRFFEQYGKYKKMMVIVLIISLLVFILFYTALLKLAEMGIPQPRFGLYFTLLKSYSDLAFTAFYVSLIILVFQRFKLSNKTPLLASYGRMSLTNYVMQPLIGVPLIYGYGFGEGKIRCINQLEFKIDIFGQ